MMAKDLLAPSNRPKRQPKDLLSVSRETMQPTAAGLAPPIPQPQGLPSTSTMAYLSDRAIRGLQNFAGMPGTMQDLAQRAMQRGMEFVGASPALSEAMSRAPVLPWSAAAPTPQEIQSGMESLGIDPMTGAQPAGLGTEVVGDIVEGATSFPFAPFASGVAGMTGQASRRGAENLGFGPTGQAVAQGVGGLAGGLGAAGVQRGVQQFASRPPTPAFDTLRRAKDAAYKAADNAGVVVKSDTFRRGVANIAKEAEGLGIDPNITPKATGAMRRLLREVDAGQDMPLTKIDTLRKVIRNAAKSNEPAERNVAMAMRNQLDEFLDDLKPDDLVSGDAAAVQTLKEARALNTRLGRAQTVEDLIQNAQQRATQFSGSGYENALRTEFRQLAKNPKRMRLFTPDQQEAIKAVNEGAPLANFFRYFGKWAPTGVVSLGAGAGPGAAIGAYFGGPPGAIIGGSVVPTIGAAGRLGATALTSQAAREARNMMLRGYRAPVLPSSAPQGVASGLLPNQPEATLLESTGLMGP